MFSLGSSESGKTLYLEIVKADFCCLIRATFKGKHRWKKVVGENPDKHGEIQPHTYSSMVCAKV